MLIHLYFSFLLRLLTFMHLTSLIYLDPSLDEAAREWAQRLSLRCIDGCSISPGAKARQAFIYEQCKRNGDSFALVLDKDGLALHALDLQGNTVSICPDFHGARATYRRMQGGGKRQMIARAVGMKGGACQWVLDATAGLGRDAFVLASLGCRVTLLEREPVICALLEDAIVRAKQFADKGDPVLREILERMSLVQADARDYMGGLQAEERPDVVYLDPMFPLRTKSARVKKEMQVLHQLLGADDTADATLLEGALRFARQRVVVKRPRLAPELSEVKPSHTLEGTRNRYDVYRVI